MRNWSRLQVVSVVVWIACTLLKLGSLAFNIHVIGQTAQDTGAYYGAGYALNHGVSPYDTAAWRALLPGIESERYVYPPFWAVLWRLPAMLDFTTVRWLMVAVNLVALGVSLWLIARACGLSRVQFGVLLVSACASVPVFGTFFLGQVSLILLLLVVTAVVMVDRHPMWAGACIGIATGIKLFPIVCIWALYRVWGRRGWLGLGLGALVTLVVGLIGAPLRIWRAYLAVGLIPDSGPPRWSMNRSGIWNVVARMFDTHAYTFDGVTYQLPAVWHQPALVMPVAVVVSLGVCAVTAWVLLRTRAVWPRMGLVLAALLLVMPFQSTHYAVLGLVPVAILLGSRQTWGVLALVALCDTAVRYQYNVVRITQQTWPASAGLVMLGVLWLGLVWQLVSVPVPQSPIET